MQNRSKDGSMSIAQHTTKYRALNQKGTGKASWAGPLKCL